MSYFLFGQLCDETSAADPRAIGAAFDVEGRIVRPPIGVAKSVERVANGAAAYLSTEALGHLSLLGIEVERGDAGKYTATKQIKAKTYFRPSR